MGSRRGEAELYTDAGDGSWLERSSNLGYGGHGYVIGHGVLAGPPRGFDAPYGLTDAVQLDVGRYGVERRRLVPSVWGALGRGGDQSTRRGPRIDGVVVGHAEEGGAADPWEWVPVGEAVLASGEHRIELRVREGGIAVDVIPLRQLSRRARTIWTREADANPR